MKISSHELRMIRRYLWKGFLAGLYLTAGLSLLLISAIFNIPTIILFIGGGMVAVAMYHWTEEG